MLKVGPGKGDHIYIYAEGPAMGPAFVKYLKKQNNSHQYTILRTLERDMSQTSRKPAKNKKPREN